MPAPGRSHQRAAAAGRSRLWAAALGAAAAIALPGCGGDPQEDALGQLYEKDLPFSVDRFLKAAKDGEADSVRTYLAAGMAADAENEFGDRALLFAAERGHHETVAVLLAAGAEPDAPGAGLRTPLMGAAEAGDFTSLERLLAAGADPMRRDVEGWSALRLAAFHGHEAIVGALLPHALPEQFDGVFLLACVGGHVGTIDRLLGAGADLYRRTPEGQTALMLAAARGHERAVQILLQHGADRFATDPEGATAAQHAERSGETDIAEALAAPPSADEIPGAPLPALDAAEFELPGQVWRLDGAELESGPGAASGRGDARAAEPAAKLIRYREARAPMELEAIAEGPDGTGAASLRFLFGSQQPVWVRVGERIPDLPFRIDAVEHRTGTDKDGQPILVQTARITDLRTGKEFEMTPGDPGRSAFTTVDLRDARGRSFRGGRGDRFRLRTADGTSVPFRILEMRPDEVLVERLDTGRVVAWKREKPEAPGSA